MRKSCSRAQKRTDGVTQILVALTALGVFVIFAAGLWLIIEADRKATKLREEQEKRRKR